MKYSKDYEELRINILPVLMMIQMMIMAGIIEHFPPTSFPLLNYSLLFFHILGMLVAISVGVDMDYSITKSFLVIAFWECYLLKFIILAALGKISSRLSAI